MRGLSARAGHEAGGADGGDEGFLGILLTAEDHGDNLAPRQSLCQELC